MGATSIHQLVATHTAPLIKSRSVEVTCLCFGIGAVITFSNVGSIVQAFQSAGTVVTFRGIAAITFPGTGSDVAFFCIEDCTAEAHLKMASISVAYQPFVNAGGFVILSGACMCVLPAAGAVPGFGVEGAHFIKRHPISTFCATDHMTV